MKRLRNWRIGFELGQGKGGWKLTLWLWRWSRTWGAA